MTIVYNEIKISREMDLSKISQNKPSTNTVSVKFFFNESIPVNRMKSICTLHYTPGYKQFSCLGFRLKNGQHFKQWVKVKPEKSSN